MWFFCLLRQMTQKGIKMNRITRRNGLKHWHFVTAYLVLFDVFAMNLSYFLALWLRFDGLFTRIEVDYLNAYIHFVPIYTIAAVLVFFIFRLYQSIWRFASFNELSYCLLANLVTAFLHMVGITVLFHRMPIVYYLGGALMQFFLTISVRFSYRFILLLRKKSGMDAEGAPKSRVMLIGAGAAGQLILRDSIVAPECNDHICCIIDDNPNKWNRFIENVPVVGGRDDILLNVEKYKIDKIFLAIPSASAEEKRDILNICQETSCELKQLPGIYQLVNGDITVGRMQDVSVEDLLGREPIRADLDEVFRFLTGKTILVTGGGGSIGSELCRQIASHSPKQLIIFDVYENNAYAIQMELKDQYPNLNLTVLIGSVRDSKRINQVFAEYRPDVVYHAAAHKHVPLMEDSPCESIKNNAIGTYKTAYAAMLNGCKRFVLISTDKAVNPTNIMGASKRLCEMVIQTFDRMIKEGRASELPLLRAHMDDEMGSISGQAEMVVQPCTEFVAVRFGNVLGSNGSVIPRFKKQIEKGGPVTVTHPDIIRYFMTIPEAVSLVLQAGTYARGGEIFVLDMGAPVKIDTLARNLIRLSGLRPDVDIEITYTGLRPGEKLYEEKLMAEEGLQRTKNDLIHIGKPIPFDADVFLVQLQQLMNAAYEECEEDIFQMVAQVVTTYHPDKSNV